MGSKHGKQQSASNQREEKKEQDSTIENHHVENYIMKKPYVIIVGIGPYEGPWTTLTAIPQDIANMKDLWINKFKYDPSYVTIVTEEINSDYVSLTALNKQLNKIQSELELEHYKDCDGLIIIYSGHGSTNGANNYILTSDIQTLPIIEIQNKFSSKGCVFLANKPKIFYFDCCRGDNDISASDIEHRKGNTGISSRYINPLSDFFIHFATCQDYGSWGKSVEKGSHFIYAVYNCYINNIESHKINGISLHESSIKINEMVNKSHKGQQTSEILDRLTYNVYVQPNSTNTTTNEVNLL